MGGKREGEAHLHAPPQVHREDGAVQPDIGLRLSEDGRALRLVLGVVVAQEDDHVRGADEEEAEQLDEEEAEAGDEHLRVLRAHHDRLLDELGCRLDRGALAPVARAQGPPA